MTMTTMTMTMKAMMKIIHMVDNQVLRTLLCVLVLASLADALMDMIPYNVWDVQLQEAGP